MLFSKLNAYISTVNVLMQVTDIHIIQQHVVAMLKNLSPELTYHSTDHTLDVLKQSIRIGNDEGINETEKYRLAVAALYHDTGFLETYFNHEEKSCRIFLEDCNKFLFSETDIELITGMIMATKVPQRPKTLLQRIICDADLDYLGRNDFHDISEKLKKEFLHYHVVENIAEWKSLQVTFLHRHHYHTAASRLVRNARKLQNIERFAELHSL